MVGGLKEFNQGETDVLLVFTSYDKEGRKRGEGEGAAGRRPVLSMTKMRNRADLRSSATIPTCLDTADN